MPITKDDDWPLQAKCRGMNDALFPEGKDQKRAKSVCMGCPVRAICLAEALDNRIEWGVWGGMTERERRQLLRQRPDVKSWAAVLGAAMEEQEAVRVVDRSFDREAAKPVPEERNPVAKAERPAKVSAS